jgi:serine/threonine protein kinase
VCYRAGTAGMTAPEMFNARGCFLGKPADIYSLGIMIRQIFINFGGIEPPFKFEMFSKMTSIVPEDRPTAEEVLTILNDFEKISFSKSPFAFIRRCLFYWKNKSGNKKCAA